MRVTVSREGSCRRAGLLWVALAGTCLAATARASAPRLLREARSQPGGMDADLRRLWSRKTGLEAGWRLMERSRVLPALRAGRVGVAGVGTMRHFPWRWVLGVGAVVALGAGLLALWNIQLRRRVGRATRSLRDGERRYRDLVENSPIPIAVHADEKIVLLNRRAAEVLGGTAPQEFLGEAVWDYVHPAFGPTARERVEQIYRDGGDAPAVEGKLLRADGRTIDVEIEGTATSYEGRPACQIVFSDITDRKETERSLREENSFRRAIIERAAEGLCVCHDIPEHPYLRFTVWNDRLTEITGYDMEEINRRGWYQTVYPDPEVQQRAKERIDRMREGKDLVREEWEITRADGEPRFVSFSTTLLESSDGKTHVLGLMHDVTERTRAEEAIEERLRFERLLSSISARFINLPAGEVDREIRRTVRRLVEFLDVDRGTVLERSAETQRFEVLQSWTAGGGQWNPFPDVDAPPEKVFPWYARCVSEGRTVVVSRLSDLPEEAARERQYCLEHGVKSQLVIPLGVGGSVIGVVAFGCFRAERDWPEGLVQRFRLVGEILANALARRQAEEALHESERFARSTLNGLSSHVAILNADGVIEAVNDAWRDFAEAARAPVAEVCEGANYLDVCDRADGDEVAEGARFAQAIRGILAGRRGHFEMEYFCRVNGEERWFVGRVTRFPGGGAPRAVVAHEDISERKRLEAQLRQAQKMEAIGQLAGGVAHDFNNLLQAIRGYTDLSLAALDEDGPLRANLQEVRRASDRAAALTRRLLAFSRRETVQPRHLDLNDVIGDLMKMLRRVIGEHVELAVREQTRVPPVYADPGHLEQILMNLCINARDAMAGGGTVTIETGVAHFDAESCRQKPWAKEGDFVVLTVSDTGKGIPEEIHDRIFEPFFTTKDMGEGTGLGLATVYAIVERQGGMIRFESAPACGTTFRVYFPAAEAPPAASADDARDADGAGGSETILLAEDDESVRKLAATVLERAGYRLVLARDGDEALRLFEQHAETIDLAIVDVVMPRKSGREVHDAVRAARPGVPVLFTSGYSRGAIEASRLPAGGSQLLQKPYSPGALLREVRQALDARPASR